MREKFPGYGVMPLAKLAIIILFLNYYCFALIRGSLIPKCSIICYGIMALSWLVDYYNHRGYGVAMPREISYWIMFAVFSLMTIPVAYSSSVTMATVLEYIQRLFLTYVIIYIALREESVRFPLTALSVVCLGAAVAILPNLASISGRVDIESGFKVSVNDIGSLTVFGLFAVQYFGETKRISSFIKPIIKIGCMLIVIVLMFISGSRKAFYASVILMGLLLTYGRSKEKEINVNTILAVLFGGFIVFFIVNTYLLDAMYETSLFMRLFGRKAEAAAISDGSRVKLYQYAFQEFMANPLFGLGLGGFAVKYGGYTHSTYAEPIACSGVLSILYFVPFIRIMLKQLRLIKYSYIIPEDNTWHRQLFALYVAFLFVGVGIPYIYKDLPCIVLALMISSQEIGKSRIYEVYEELDNERETD